MLGSIPVIIVLYGEGLDLRIVHVLATLSSKMGGPVRAVLGMSEALASLGHAVSIHCTDFSPPPVGGIDRAKEASVRVQEHRVERPLFIRRSTQLRAALNAEIPAADVVHIHSLYLYHTLVAARLARAHGVPYILRPHGTWDPFQRKHHFFRKSVADRLFQNWVTRHAAAVHFTTQDESRLCTPYIGNTPSFIAPNGVWLDEFANDGSGIAFGEEFPRVGPDPFALFLGRLNFKKGLDILLPGYAAALDGIPGNAKLVVAGPADDWGAKARRLTTSLGLDKRVVFTGELGRSQVRAALRAASFFVLPSYAENFGISVVEAMASACPVVISDQVNIHEEVNRAGAGMIIEASVPDVTRSITAMFASEHDWQAMGARGKQLVQQRFTWEAAGRTLESAYRSVVGSA